MVSHSWLFCYMSALFICVWVCVCAIRFQFYISWPSKQYSTVHWVEHFWFLWFSCSFCIHLCIFLLKFCSYIFCSARIHISVFFFYLTVWFECMYFPFFFLLCVHKRFFPSICYGWHREKCKVMQQYCVCVLSQNEKGLLLPFNIPTWLWCVTIYRFECHRQD